MGKQRNRRAFWDSTLSARKVRNAIESYFDDPEHIKGVLEAIESGYKAQRKQRELRPVEEAFSPEQVEAIKRYRQHANLSRLASELGRSQQGAASVVARALTQGLFSE